MATTAPDIDAPVLGYFEDEPVWEARLRVKGLGDGLSKLAEIEPVALTRRHRGALVVEFFVDAVAFVPGKSMWDQPGLHRLHTLRAGLVTVVDPKSVSKVLNAHQRKLDEAENRRALFQREPDGDEPGGDE